MRRRHFITSTIGAGLLAGATASGAASTDASGGGALAPGGGPATPQDKPANPFSSRIVPITKEERSRRIEKARRRMSGTGIDALILEGGTTMRYFTGVRWGRSERTFLMVLPSAGEPWYISPKFEESRALEQVSPSPLYTWEEDESPFDLLRTAMRDRGMAIATVALEESTRYFVTEGIGKALSSAKVVNGTPVTAECRAVKSGAELALMQVANDITAEVYRKSVPQLKPGMTEGEFGSIISTTFSGFGVSGGALVLFGEASAHPHGLEKESVLREGDIVLIDGGCGVEGYSSDVTRTTVLGAPTDRMKTVFDAVLRSQRAGLKAARPGVAGEAIDAAARRVVDEAGFGPGYTRFTHRLGHGIGMEGHEWFYLVRGNTRPEQAGDVHSNEPGIYLPGEFGVRIEDEMVITQDGARLMLPSPSGLESMFG
jgi:Xaa-Pro dipeptidase